jgi:hypothetical protein
VLLIVACIGAAHFLIALILWVVALVTVTRTGLDGVYWIEFARAIPAVVLLSAFAVGAVLARRGHRAAVLLVPLALCLSAAWFAYDVVHAHYQLQIMTADEGCKHVYCNWWWYRGP